MSLHRKFHLFVYKRRLKNPKCMACFESAETHVKPLKVINNIWQKAQTLFHANPIVHHYQI